MTTNDGKRVTGLCAASVALLVSACASTSGPSKELVLARQAYVEATTPGMPIAVDPMIESQRLLNAAEVEHRDRPQSVRERHLSYLATRQAQIAMARGDEAAAKATADAAKQQRIALLVGYGKDQHAALLTAQKERDTAVAALEKIGTVDKTGANLALTLDGGVLFPLDQATLGPAARKRLDAMAEALKAVPADQHISLVGYADATGREVYNAKLSKVRAEAVRYYLLSRGVRSDLLVTEARGELEPVASNADEQGRSKNRRVELVLRGGQTARAE